MLALLLCLTLIDPPLENERIPIQTGFVVVDGVYNSELIAPLDILQHSLYRKNRHYFRTFVISPAGKPVKTAEGLTIHADYSFENAPDLDVLVIPSTTGSMGKDLDNKAYMKYIAAKVKQASAVITLCDGAFPLAQTGVLNGLYATTFPGDQEAFAVKYPEVNVVTDVWFVAHDKFITGVGGARSYEPALYLAHRWFDQAYARRLAQGLVIDWGLDKIPHKHFGELPKRPH
jgi:transcriptional regulator GlxA family with amidase domain